MQQIERVGAVALLFLLVTIVAVALWDEGDPARPEEADEDVARAEDTQHATRRRPREERAAESPPRDRHDGLRAVRAGSERQGTRGSDLLGQTSDVAPVRTREAPDPGRGPARGERPPEPRPEPAEDPVEEDPLLRERGWSNGRPARRHRQEAARQGEDGGETAVTRGEERGGARKREQREPDPANTPASGATHVVQKNETLERIARRRLGDGQRWREIAALNGIEGHLILAGQVLKLPTGAKPASPPASTPAPDVLPTGRPAARTASSEGTRTYTIRKGDILGEIALRELGTSKRWKQIVDLNPDLDPRKLFVGEEILLPAREDGTRRAESSLVADAGDDTADRYQVH